MTNYYGYEIPDTHPGWKFISGNNIPIHPGAFLNSTVPDRGMKSSDRFYVEKYALDPWHARLNKHL